MFDAFVKWMFMPGMWNDGLVYLSIMAVVGVCYLCLQKD